MSAFAGFDADGFPGLKATAYLRRAFAWCGYYLPRTPSHHDAGWSGQRAALVAQGYGLMPIYVGQELAGPGSHRVDAAQGSIDGQQAAALMRAEGFPAGSSVYLDLEDGAPFVAPRTGYVLAWALAVNAAGYRPGMYASHDIAAHVGVVATIGSRIPRLWTFRLISVPKTPAPLQPFTPPLPGACGVPDAFAWQYSQNVPIDAGGPKLLTVDLSTALTADPSAP